MVPNNIEYIKNVNLFNSLYKICKSDNVLELQDYLQTFGDFENNTNDIYGIKNEYQYIDELTLRYISKFSSINYFKYFILNFDIENNNNISQYITSIEMIRECLLRNIFDINDLIFGNDEIFKMKQNDLINYLYEQSNDEIKNYILIKSLKYSNLTFINYCDSFISNYKNSITCKINNNECYINISKELYNYLNDKNLIKFINIDYNYDT